jgi:uncharacterized protein (DUF2249 family)
MATVEIDNRGLVPPEPMVRILSALGALAGGDELVALMDREPVLLYGELERRGCTWEFGSGTGPGGSDVLRIRRTAGP